MINIKSVVTIGIVTYNSEAYIQTCLNSVQNQTVANINIVIFDNASIDNTVNLIKEHYQPHQFITNSTNIGFGQAHNTLINSTLSHYYLALNPDIVLQPDFVEHMLKPMNYDSTVGWVSGKLYVMDASPLLYTVGHAVFRDGYAVNIGSQCVDNGQYDDEREIFGANAAAVLYRRTMLESIQVNLGETFDASIFLYHEDVDLDWRARLLGWRCLYIPDAIGYHKGGHSGGMFMSSTIRLSVAIRYYSAFKYFFLRDLLIYVIPIYMIHTLLILLVSPCRGIATIAYVGKRLRRIYQHRKWIASHRKLSYRDFNNWFNWSREQHHHQAMSLQSKIRRNL